MEAVESLIKERKQLINNAINIKKNERTPLFSNFFTWKILDAGYKLSEGMDNYEIMEKIVCEFHERYQFDAYMDLGSRNPKRVTDALGAGYHKINDENESIEVIDHKLMEQNEYNELADNPMKFYWEKAFARYCNFDLTIAQLQNAAMEFGMFGQFCQKMNDKFIRDYQCLLPAPYFLLPFEQFFNTLRGIKELSIDIRKNKSEIINAMKVLYQTTIIPSLETVSIIDTSNFFSDAFTVILGHSILNIKQFEELYWPYLKQTLDQLTGKTIFIFCESEMLRLSEFFQDIPKGQLMIHLEQDDIFEMRKKLPNIAFAGGMPTVLLGHGTPQQCVDYSKKLIDELGDGYVFSTNKMMSFRNDSKRENLLAVTDFVRNYKH